MPEVTAARIVDMPDAPMVNATRGLIAGLSVIFWSFATWLIPVLFAAGVWRHWFHRVPLRYQPTPVEFRLPDGYVRGRRDLSRSGR